MPRILLIVLALFFAVNAGASEVVNESVMETMGGFSTGMAFVKGGCFEMGDTFGDEISDAKPVHEVCVDSFYMGTYEVTVGEFREFVRDTGYVTEAEIGDGCYGWTGSAWIRDRRFNWRNVGFSQDAGYPVVCVTWNDANEYTKWRSKKDGLNYRLPTEAEWEYAARSAGKRHKYSWGNEEPSGNIADESAKREFPGWKVWSGYDDGYVFTAPVGSFDPNALGLYDMSGNVWEWVRDWYGKEYYKSSPLNNPEGPLDGKYRVLRGGSWDSRPTKPTLITTSYRYNYFQDTRYVLYGFRLVLAGQE